MPDIRPNEAEKLFLNLAYNRFYDIFDEVFVDSFWKKDSFYRLSKIRDAFSIYTELLHYEPIQWTLSEMEIHRPPMEAEIAKDLFKFIRNIIVHFPFFESWDDIWFNQLTVNWHKSGQSIDQFLNKNLSTKEVKYRFWEEKTKTMTYLSINYPKQYDNTHIHLTDIISEKDGVKFSLIMMRQIIDVQVE